MIRRLPNLRWNGWVRLLQYSMHKQLSVRTDHDWVADWGVRSGANNQITLKERKTAFKNKCDFTNWSRNENNERGSGCMWKQLNVLLIATWKWISKTKKTSGKKLVCRNRLTWWDSLSFLSSIPRQLFDSCSFGARENAFPFDICLFLLVHCDKNYHFYMLFHRNASEFYHFSRNINQSDLEGLKVEIPIPKSLQSR